MGRYSTDYKSRKDYSFSLESQKDPSTNLSEVDMLNEVVRMQGTTISKYVREALVETFKKLKPSLNNMPQLDKYMEKENYIFDEPTLKDYFKVHEEFVSKSDFSIDEMKRRAGLCMRLSKFYDNEASRKEDEEWRNSHPIRSLRTS